MRISDALKFKRDLAHETTAHNSAFANMLVSSFTSLQSLTDLEVESVRNVISGTGLPSIRRSEVFFMGREVTSEFLNRGLGPEPTRLGSTPPFVSDGLVVFEYPIRLTPDDVLSVNYDPDDAATRVIPISAMSWSAGMVPTSTPDMQIVWKPGCVVMLWTRSKEIVESMKQHDDHAADELPYIAYPLTYGSAAYGGWFIAETNLVHEDEDTSDSIFYNGDSPETASPSTAVTLTQTLWTMLAEEIAVSRHQDATKKQMKMLRRAKMKDTGVSVIQLRHVEYIGDNEGFEGRIVDWSHRWYVRGHYRRIRDKHTGEEKYVWVRSHIKGPQGKPLRETEKVYALVR